MKRTPSSLLSLCALLTVFNPIIANTAELRVRFMKECPTTEYPKADTQLESAAILTALAVTFIGKVVDVGIAALKKTLVPTAKNISGDYLADGLYVRIEEAGKTTTLPNPDMNCMVVAVGEFGTSPNAWSLPFRADRAEAYTVLKETLGLKEAPTHYIEAVRKYSPDWTAVTWQPVRLYVGEHLDSGYFAGRDRGLQVDVKFFAPGAAEPFAAQSFAFGSISKPTSLGPADLESGKYGRWLALPAPTEDGLKVKPKPNGSVAIDPFTVSALLAEAPHPYQLAQIFAESVEANADGIKTEVTNALLPVRRRAAAVESRSATITAVQAYLTDQAAAVTACKDTADAAKALTCSLSKEKARGSRTTAQLACDVSSIEACGMMPPVP